MSFQSPVLLVFLLLVPAVLVLALWVDRRRAHYAVAFTNLEVLASVAEGGRSTWRRWVPLALFLAALAAAGTALARPQATVPTAASRATVVLLVDVSGSMRANDVKPTRLGAAQTAMYEFLDHVPPHVRVGLVSFSTTPDVIVLPTTDRTLMREGVDVLAPEAGTAIGDGLHVAVDVALQSVGQHARRGRNGKIPAAIVLLSDGAQTRGVLRPLDGAAEARRAGIPVYTIALGTKNGTIGIGPYGGFGFGQVAPPSGAGRFPVRPDPATLRAISQATGGDAFQATSASKVSEVYRKLSNAVITHTTKREISSWFVGAAAFILLASIAAAKWTGERLP